MSVDQPVRLDRWWQELTAVALVGTGRRTPPVAPDAGALAALPLDGAARGVAPEEALLDAVALGSALRRAGGAAPTPPAAVEDTAAAQGAAAPPDRLPPPPARARQLLDLLLQQPPVGARMAPVTVRAWLRAAAAAGVRVHHPALVRLLEMATRERSLRPDVLPVLDARGAWLAAANPGWSWAAPGGVPAAEPDPASWAALPTAHRAVVLRLVRADDPAAGRALLTSTWASDSALARAELLGALEVGIGPDDEELLERALDDRSLPVREVAWRLLEGLPGSARAQRLGAVLAPLLSSTGRLRRRVQVLLPDAVGPEAVRDGLGPAPRGRSQRGWWLQRVAAGAPLATWTDVTGLDPATVVRTLEDADALAGIRTAALARRDPVWARALLDRTWEPGLVRVLPAAEAEARVLARVAEVTSLGDLASTLRLVEAPWSPELSAAALARVDRLERVPYLVADLVPVLAEGLHPAAAGTVRRLAAGAGPADPLSQLAQHLALVPTITEAFT